MISYEGVPKLPTDEKRLAIGVSALKAMVRRDEVTETSSITALGSMPLRWVPPTQKMLADGLPKLMDGKDIIDAIETGRISLVAGDTEDHADHLRRGTT